MEHWWRRIQFLTALVVVMLSASGPPQPPEGVPNHVRPAPIVPVNKRQGRLLRIVVVADARPAGCEGEAEAREEQVETGQQGIPDICRQRRRRMRRRRNDDNNDNDDNKRQH